MKKLKSIIRILQCFILIVVMMDQSVMVITGDDSDATINGMVYPELEEAIEQVNEEWASTGATASIISPRVMTVRDFELGIPYLLMGNLGI